MSPPAFHFDPTEASKQVLRHGIKRASIMRKHASHLGKRASLATRRLNHHPILYITDTEGRGTPLDPEFRYWDTSVTNVQQVYSYGGENHERVRGYTRHTQYYVKNISKEPSTALYSNPEYARSSTCLSALSVDAFENFDGANTVATDSEISSVASSFACATSHAVESATNISESTESSQRSSLISIPEISDSAPVLPDFSTDFFEPFEVHFPADTTSIRISFTFYTPEALTPGVPSPLPSVLRPGLPQRPSIPRIIPRRPVPKATPNTDAIPQPRRAAPQPARNNPRFVPETTLSRHVTNLSSRYPKLDTNKPLPRTPHRISASHRPSRHTPLAHRAIWAQDEPTTPATAEEPEHLRAEYVEGTQLGRTISGHHSRHGSPPGSPVKGKGKHSWRRGWNKVFDKK